MSSLPSYFTDFIAKIKLQADLREHLQEAHKELTTKLHADKTLEPIVVDSFLQGSYKRATILEPDDEDVADVDIVVVTRLNERDHPEPATAMALFEPFLNRNYPGKWERQDRSFGITDGRIKMDLVITSAPSEALVAVLNWRAVKSNLTLEDDSFFRLRKGWVEPRLQSSTGSWKAIMEAENVANAAWRNEPLRIPDRTRRCWEPTHPLYQIDWTIEKNQRCNEHYLDIVRALKSWRRGHPTPKYPKGYPVEHMVGDACPDGVNSTAEGVALTFENLHSKWNTCAQLLNQPFLQDHGVAQNVLRRVDPSDFAEFYKLVGPASTIARAALDAEDKHVSVQLWQKLFGSRFPDAPALPPVPGGTPDTRGGFTPRKEVGVVGGGRFA